MARASLQPSSIGPLELASRIVMGAMHLGVEALDDAGARMAAFYAARARGGATLIVTGGAAVSRAGAGGPGYGLINEPAGARAYGEAARAVADAGGRICLQLFHAGRYAFPDAFGIQPVAPSAIASRFNRVEPAALDDAGVRATIADFARGAERARELGFDAVEIMGSEGYLLDQFLSPLTNRRDDDWGGDAERRMRFGLELLGAVHAAVGPGFPVIVRFSGADLMEGSTSRGEVLGFAEALAAAGADALNVGVGWHEARVPTVQQVVPPATWVPVAEAVAEVAGTVPVIASNRIATLEDADRVLAGGRVAFVSMARPFLADPALMSKARAGRDTAVNVCIACNQACIDRSLVGERVSCLVNPSAGRELELARRGARASGTGTAGAGADAGGAGAGRTGADGGSAGVSGVGTAGAGAATPRRRFAVVGGGPAGLEAARALAADGHEVELFEAAERLGGQFRLAELVPGKEVYGTTIRYFAGELARLGVHVYLGAALDDAGLARLADRDGIVLATGVRPRPVTIPGADLPHVLAYDAAFAADPAALGERIVVVGGGGIAVDLAHRLAEHGGPPATPERFLRAYGVASAVAPATAAPDEPAAPSGAGPADRAPIATPPAASAAAATVTPPAGDPASAAPPTATRRRPSPIPPPAITLLRRGGRIGAGIGRTTRWTVLDALRRAGVATMTGVSYEAIEPGGVRIRDAEGVARLLAADTVVIAAGQEPHDPLATAAAALGVPVRTIGGARDAAGLDAVRAFAEGLDAALELGGATA